MKRLVLAALLSLAPFASPAAVTSAQWGVDRTTSPWSVCIYDSSNTCQAIFTVPSSGGGALVPSAHGGTGINNGVYTITLGGYVSFGSSFSTTGAFNTGGAFSTGSTFSTTGAFATGGALSTAGPFTMSGAFSFTGNVTGNTNVTFPTSGTLLTSATLGVMIGSTTISGGTNGDIEFNNAGVFGEKPVTGSGNVVLATSPTLITPALGTPSSANLTNATGLPLASGISGFGTGVAASLANGLNASGGPISPAQTRTGDVIYNNSGTWSILAGNNSGTGYFSENSSGTPSWGSPGTVTSITPGSGLSTSPTSTATAPITSTGTLYPDASYEAGFLGGLVLSNDTITPNTVLDIAAGAANDSTNVARIKLVAFSKTTAGAWTSGSGNAGMGNGLTIANSTWYHVCLAFNGGTSDVWFDTSAACANKPSGISGSLFRRIGSFKTDSSAHILAFYQVGNRFGWVTPHAEFSSAISTVQTLATLIYAPSGVVTTAVMRLTASGASTWAGLFTPVAETGSTAVNTPAGNYTLNAGAGIAETGEYDILLNASAQFNIVSTSSVTYTVSTVAWIDTRGQ